MGIRDVQLSQRIECFSLSPLQASEYIYICTYVCTYTDLGREPQFICHFMIYMGVYDTQLIWHFLCIWNRRFSNQLEANCTDVAKAAKRVRCGEGWLIPGVLQILQIPGWGFDAPQFTEHFAPQGLPKDIQNSIRHPGTGRNRPNMLAKSESSRLANGKILRIKLAVLEYGAIYIGNMGELIVYVWNDHCDYMGGWPTTIQFLSIRGWFCDSKHSKNHVSRSSRHCLKQFYSFWWIIWVTTCFFLSAIRFSGDHNFHPCRQLPHHLQLNYQ